MTLHSPVSHFISHTNGKQKAGLWGNSYADGKRRGHWTQQYKTDSIYCLVQGKDRVAEYIRNGQLAEMEVFVFFISKMTLLVRIVGGSKLTPYDSNCSESVCVCVFVLVCMLVCAKHSGVCVSGHQTELQGLRQGTVARWIRSELQRANVKEEILPSTLLPLEQDTPLHRHQHADKIDIDKYE